MIVQGKMSYLLSSYILGTLLCPSVAKKSNIPKTRKTIFKSFVRGCWSVIALVLKEKLLHKVVEDEIVCFVT